LAHAKGYLAKNGPGNGVGRCVADLKTEGWHRLSAPCRRTKALETHREAARFFAAVFQRFLAGSGGEHGGRCCECAPREGPDLRAGFYRGNQTEIFISWPISTTGFSRRMVFPYQYKICSTKYRQKHRQKVLGSGKNSCLQRLKSFLVNAGQTPGKHRLKRHRESNTGGLFVSGRVAHLLT